MTLKIRRILLPIRDLDWVPRAALKKAAVLARATGAHIELFHAVENASSSARGAPRSRSSAKRAPPPAAEAALARARRNLERIARSSLVRGCQVRSSVAFDAPAHEAIIRRALASRSSLVIASTRTHGRAARLFLRNTDWELIRHCPGALLLAKSRSGYRKPVILVAVDPFHVHAKPARLDAELLAAGREMARLLGGSVHIFHAYMPLPANVEGPLGEPITWENAEIEKAHGAQVRGVFDRFAEKAGIAPARRHLAMGDVPGELQEMVRRLTAAIVVMGAVSRSGLQRIFIGSTSERVLDRLGCDVLILKPKGFKTSVPVAAGHARRRRGR
jgi:universal stress protein E